MSEQLIPHWAIGKLRCPNSNQPITQIGNQLHTPDGSMAACIEHNVIRFPIKTLNDSIAFYREIGGAHFHERSSTPFAMSSLDTPVYHQWLEKILPRNRDELIVDVGGGDGRNAIALLRKGARRVIVIDVVAEALIRFRTRVEQLNPGWLDHLLLIEADARNLPLLSECASAVLSIETLCYLNEEYGRGLDECARLLAPGGRILIADRDYEGGLVLRLLYQGIDAMLKSAGTRDIWDGRDVSVTKSRCFTENELHDAVRSVGLRIVTIGGLSILSLLLGYLNGQHALRPNDSGRIDEVHKLLIDLARNGALRRSHVIIGIRD